MNQLDIDAVSKRYGTHLALDAMSFTVRAGEIFGFVGSNGAGKTTTMRIAVGVLSADSGTVRWSGRPITAGATAHFGYMPEERGLYPKMTVAAQLVYLGRLHKMSAPDARAAMLRWTERLRIAEHRDRTVESLSLGNQQRVQLAAALVHDPDVLVLDEPFSGLDPLAVDDMSAVLRDKATDGTAVLFSSHQLELVERLCDRVGVVNAGTMVNCGTLDELSRALRPRLFLRLEGAPADWPDHTGAVTSFEPADDGVIVELAPGCDENTLLSQAMHHGTVRQMSWRRPTLTQMFRDLTTPTHEKAAL